MTDAHDTTGGPVPPSSLRDQTLASLPLDLHAKVLTNAADAGITHKDDAAWQIVRDIIAANAAAAAAGTAATSVHDDISQIGVIIYQSAAKAATDVKATLETSITGTVNTAISSAAQAGADALRKAAADLPAMAHAEQGRIVQEWKSALAQAARNNAFAGFLQRISVNITALAVIVGGIFVGGVLSGGAGIEFIMSAQHRLTPPGWRLLVDQKGKPECGALAGHAVCLARKAKHPT